MIEAAAVRSIKGSKSPCWWLRMTRSTNSLELAGRARPAVRLTRIRATPTAKRHRWRRINSRDSLQTLRNATFGLLLMPTLPVDEALLLAESGEVLEVIMR